MTTFLLIRHAAYDLLDQCLAGRTTGLSLNAEGRVQVAALRERLASLPLRAVYSSPLERACETAEPLAQQHGLPLELSDELGELDFGEWSGQTFESLTPVARWRQWNRFRSGTRAPGGELMLEAQLRIVAALVRLRKQHPGALVALVTHGDLIRSAVAHALGMPLDLLLRLDIRPASVTTLRLDEEGPQLLGLNHMGALPVT